MNSLRLEALLIAQQSLRCRCEKANRLWLFEIERAIEEIQGGCSCSHTETVERWCSTLLVGGPQT